MRQDIHPELAIDGFSALDGTVRFYGFVRAIQLKHHCASVLDFGAGRGKFWHDDSSSYRRGLQDLRTVDNRVTASDVDPVVRDHPCSHEQVVLEAGQALPFEDDTFDLIVSDMTFEHLTAPREAARELTRILKPGGFLCVRTPNRWGYVAVLTRLTPNRLHRAILRRVQPERKVVDVFPTVYAMNTPGTLKRLFSDLDVVWYTDNGEPSYYGKSAIVYRVFLGLHKLTPRAASSAICAFMRKPEVEAQHG